MQIPPRYPTLARGWARDHVKAPGKV